MHAAYVYNPDSEADHAMCRFGLGRAASAGQPGQVPLGGGWRPIVGSRQSRVP